MQRPKRTLLSFLLSEKTKGLTVSCQFDRKRESRGRGRFAVDTTSIESTEQTDTVTLSL